jgi:hypothetical protein
MQGIAAVFFRRGKKLKERGLWRFSGELKKE